MNKLQRILRGALFGRYLSVGVIGAAVESALVFALTGPGTLESLPAKAVGAEIAIVLMFLINDAWTFADEGKSGYVALFRRFLRSHTVRIVGLTVAFLVLFFLTDMTSITFSMGGLDMWPTLANLVGIGIGFAVNFVGESIFTWGVADVR